MELLPLTCMYYNIFLLFFQEKVFLSLGFFCRVTIDVTPLIYQKSKKSDKILIETKFIYRKDFLL